MDILTLLLFTVLILVLIKFSFKRSNYPPGPTKIPFLGNGALVKKYTRRYGCLHAALIELCKVYETDILSLKLGRDNVVVVQKRSLVEEVFVRDVFQGRPNTFFIKLRSMGTRKGITMTDGPLWKEQRAFALKHMHSLGLGKSKTDYLINQEVEELFKKLKDGKRGNLKNEITKCMLNVLWAIVTGGKFASEETLEGLVGLMSERAKAFDMSGGILSQFPWIRFIAPEWSGYNIITRLNKKFQNMIHEIIDEHKKTYKEDTTRDFIDAFLHEMYQNNNNAYFTEDQLIMVCMDFFIAGSETVSSTLDFMLLHMIVFPEIQQKVQNEIDSVLEKGRPILTFDRSQLTYTDAMISESQRLSHIIPILGPKRVLSETSLGGYTIDKDTIVFVNAVPLAKNPEEWNDPDDFRPERFFDNKHSEKFNYGFGKGKRRCPGEPLAKSFLFIFITSFLQKYQIEADEMNPPTLDFNPGITLSPKPYTMKIKKR